MNNIYEFPELDNRYDEASLWCSRMDKGLSAAEEAALQEWMAADDENQQVLFEMTRLWDNMTVMSRLSDLLPQPAKHTRRTVGLALAVAASTAFAVIAVSWMLWSAGADVEVGSQQVAIPANIYETEIGEQSTVILLDGTQIVLNTNSRIEVTYTDAYRLLRLSRGEIHVDVAPDKDRPFSVVAGDKIVQAVGTAFSLEITDDQKIELVVTEGKVLIGVHQESPAAAAVSPPPVLEPTSVAVVAGEEIVLGAPVEDIVRVSPEEIEVRLSWRSGNLIFRGESLEEAVSEVGRYTTLEFVILDDELKKVAVAGRFRAGDIDGLLAVLRSNFNIVYERTDDGKILLTKS